MTRSILLGGTVLLMGFMTGTPAFADKFDGQWNMRFSSNSPNPACSQFGGMVVTIRNNQASGRLYHPQVGQFDLTAAVADDGAVKDGVMRGYTAVTVAGKIEDKSGRGTWNSTTVACAGEWTLTK